MMNAAQKAQQEKLLLILIFPIREIWIPEDWEEALLNVNIWPSDYTTEQCREMFKQKEFTRKNTVFHTKAERLEYTNYYGELKVPK